MEAESAAGATCPAAGASEVPESPLDQLPVIRGFRAAAASDGPAAPTGLGDSAPAFGLVARRSMRSGALPDDESDAAEKAPMETLQGNTSENVASSSSRNDARKKSYKESVLNSACIFNI